MNRRVRGPLLLAAILHGAVGVAQEAAPAPARTQALECDFFNARESAGEHLETPRANRSTWLGILPEPLGPRRNALTLEASSQFLRPNWEQTADGRTFARLDGEEWQLTGDLGMDLGPGRLGTRLRLVHRSGGVADQLFWNWHSVFNLPQGGREAAPKNRLDMRLVRDGRVVAELRHAKVQLMDTDVSYTVAGGDLRQGWRAGMSLQLPTGRDTDFSGSGGLDVLAGVSGWTTTGGFRFHGQVERVHIGLSQDSAWRTVMANRNLNRYWVGAGWSGQGRGLVSGLGLDVTFAYTGSPYAVGIPRLDRPGLSQHWTFTHGALPNWSLSLSEEAGTYLNPDLCLALRRRF